jgi:hypothetical protein
VILCERGNDRSRCCKILLEHKGTCEGRPTIRAVVGKNFGWKNGDALRQILLLDAMAASYSG